MITFGETLVSIEKRELFSKGKRISISTRAFSILELLIIAKGQLVTRKELFAHVWPNTIVEPNNLQVHICALRKALGADRRYLKTISGRGYILAIDASPLVKTPELHSYKSNPFVNFFTAEHYCSVRLVELVGRSPLIKKVYETLVQSSLITLVGAGGVGKTVLAEVIAKAYLKALHSNRLFLISVSDIFSSNDLDLALSNFLEIQYENHDSTITTFIEAIRNENSLIVFDGCEHLLDIVAPVCKRILKECPNVKIIATSREPLRIALEHIVVVPGLDHSSVSEDELKISESPAVNLFLERSNSISYNLFKDADSLVIIREICRQLDGIPLAIELAVQHASVIGLNESLAMIKKNLRVLAGGCRTARKIHKELNTSLEWSYELLTMKEKELLFIISFFPGELNFDMIYSLVNRFGFSLYETTNCIAGLVSKSMLNINPKGVKRFYHLSNTVRYFIIQSHGNSKALFYNFHKKKAKR